MLFRDTYENCEDMQNRRSNTKKKTKIKTHLSNKKKKDSSRRGDDKTEEPLSNLPLPTGNLATADAKRTLITSGDLFNLTYSFSLVWFFLPSLESSRSNSIKKHQQCSFSFIRKRLSLLSFPSTSNQIPSPFLPFPQPVTLLSNSPQTPNLSLSIPPNSPLSSLPPIKIPTIENPIQFLTHSTLFPQSEPLLFPSTGSSFLAGSAALSLFSLFPTSSQSLENSLLLLGTLMPLH